MIKEKTTQQKHYAQEIDIVETARSNIIRYGAATFFRAFPDFRDGLKPIHRRILYSMWELKAFTDIKVAQISGQVMGRYHPHGDSSINDALVRLAQPWIMNYPYIIGQGNFGTQDGDRAAASRYIESKLSDFTLYAIFEDMDKVSVNYEDNYDYKFKIAEYLPSKIPLVLINGVSGIGEAFRVNIPPHNLNDVADACIKYINNKNISSKELSSNLYPDFPTGGEIINGEEVQKFYTDNIQVSIILRGKAELLREKNTIVLTDFPYSVDRRIILEQVKNECINGNMILSGIENIQDDNGYDDDNEEDKGFDEKRKKSTRKKTYEYICKKDSNMIEILQELYRTTSFQTSIPISFMINQNGLLKYVSIKDIIEDWYTIRVDCKRRKHTNAIAMTHNKKHVLEGIFSIYDRLDDVIDCIRNNTEGKDALIRTLHENFNLTVVQAKGIYEMSLGALSKFGLDDLSKQIRSLEEKVNENENALTRIDEIIIEELNEMKSRFGRPRQTKVVMSMESHKSASIVITKGALTVSRNAIGVFDMNGIKDSRNILTGLKPVKVNGKNVRAIIGGKGLSGRLPKAFIVCYSDGTVNRIPIETFKIVNAWYLLPAGDASVLSSAPIYDESDILVCITDDKKIKRIEASSIPGTRRLQIGSPISHICRYNEDDDDQYEHMLLVGGNGTYSLIDIDDIPLVSRNAQGVKSAYEGFSGRNFILPVPGELMDTERLFVGCCDQRDGQNYLIGLDLSNLKLSNRVSKPKRLLVPENYTVHSAEVLDIGDKTTSVCIVGKNSTGTLSSVNFKKSYEPKRVYFSPLIITLI
jgi:DNA gyrase/topoisomerase IV subunit A